MPAIDAHYAYEIKLFGLCITVETVNVFHYCGVGLIDCAVNDLLTAFETEVAANLTSIASVDMSYTNITAEEIFGGVQFGSLPIANNGVVAGDCLPPFNSWDFTYLRGGARERNGYKRMAGVPESYQAQGIASGGAGAALTAAASHLAADLNAGLILFTPCVLRKHINHVVQTTPKFYNVSSVIYSKIGSQNSRKYGHGR